MKSGQCAATQLTRFQQVWSQAVAATAAWHMALCMQRHCRHDSGSVCTTASAHCCTAGFITMPTVIVIVEGALIAPSLSVTHSVNDQIPSPRSTLGLTEVPGQFGGAPGGT